MRSNFFAFCNPSCAVVATARYFSLHDGIVPVEIFNELRKLSRLIWWQCLLCWLKFHKAVLSPRWLRNFGNTFVWRLAARKVAHQIQVVKLLKVLCFVVVFVRLEKSMLASRYLLREFTFFLSCKKIYSFYYFHLFVAANSWRAIELFFLRRSDSDPYFVFIALLTNYLMECLSVLPSLLRFPSMVAISPIRLYLLAMHQVPRIPEHVLWIHGHRLRISSWREPF